MRMLGIILTTIGGFATVARLAMGGSVPPLGIVFLLIGILLLNANKA